MGTMPKATQIVETQAKTAEKMAEKVENDARMAELYNQAENLQLQIESMANLNLLMDNTGWIELTSYPTDGPTLWQLQEAGRKLRNLAGLNAHIGRGKRLRHAYIWEGGIQHDEIPEGGSQGVRDVRKVINDPINQANYFGSAARERQEAALYTNGIYIVIGEDGVRGGTKRLRNMPLYQVTAHMVNPDDPTEIWAIRRSWSPDGIIGNEPNQLNAASGDLNHEWIFVHEHKGRQTAKVKYNGGDERVATNKRVFLEMVNRQDGWTWGLPDAIAAMAWADQYRRGVLNGLKMQEALATIAFKLKAQTTRGANAAAAKVASTTEKGGTASMADGMDIAALATAGSGYDFDSLRPVLSVVATALDVSVVALSSDPGAAGSSYGSAATLDLPTLLAMEARRGVHCDFEESILDWFGASNARAWFTPLRDAAEVYRELQAFVLPFLQGLYTPQETRDRIDGYMNWPKGTVPDGVMLPNNEKSLPRRDVDNDGQPAPSGAQTPAVDQGQNNGVGGDGNTSGNSVRTDQIT